MFADKKYSSNFALFFDRNKIILVCVAFLFAISTAVNAANIGYQSQDCCTSSIAIVPVKNERGSLSSFIYFNNCNFLSMTGTTKNASTVNNSSRTRTSQAHETRLKTLKKELDSYKLLYKVCDEMRLMYREEAQTERKLYESMKFICDYYISQTDRLQKELTGLQEFRNSIVELSLKQI